MFAYLRGHTDAIIPDGNAQPFPIFRRSNGDLLTISVVVFDGVVKDIQKDGGEPKLVEQGAISDGMLMEVKACIGARKLESVIQEDLFQQAMDGMFFFFQRYLIHGGDLQHLADQRPQPFRLPLHHFRQRSDAILIGDDLFILHSLVGDDDGSQRRMKFMGDAVDKVGFHFRKLLLSEPVAKSDKKQQYYRGDRQQRQQKSGHHQPEYGETSVKDVHMQTEADAIGMVHETGDAEKAGGVAAGDILQGTSYPDAAGRLYGGVDMRIPLPFVIKTDIFVALKGDVDGFDQQRIFQPSVDVVFFYDVPKQAVDVVCFPQLPESAVTNLLF